MIVYVRRMTTGYRGNDHTMEEYRIDNNQELCQKIVEWKSNPLTEEIIIVLP